MRIELLLRKAETGNLVEIGARSFRCHIIHSLRRGLALRAVRDLVIDGRGLARAQSDLRRLRREGPRQAWSDIGIEANRQNAGTFCSWRNLGDLRGSAISRCRAKHAVERNGGV